VADPDPSLIDAQFCYLTTTGRLSGEPREIEIWFALDGSTLYMLSGGRDHSQWVRNLIAEPAVAVRIRDRSFQGTARIVDDPDEDAVARRLLLDKYSPGYAGDLGDWGRDSLPVAIDLES
jgi:deazaflavin-dependent oxidoreductase (nitroreductase family)